jgi:non-ribosomal peptide synthetase component F/acyl carrier protein
VTAGAQRAWPGAGSADTHEQDVTPNQRAMIYLHRLVPASTALTIPVVARIEGRLDREILRGTLSTLLARHRALRTTFPETEHGPVARVAGHTVPELAWISTRDGRAPDEATARDWMQAAVDRPFDIAAGPLFRVGVLAGDDGGWFVLTVHHLVADLLSMGVIAEESGVIYSALAAGTRPALPPAPQPAPTVAEAVGERNARLREYWRAALAGAPGTLELPTERPGPPERGLSGQSLSVTLGPEATTSLRAVGRACDATLFSVLLSAFQVLLGRCTGCGDVLVGTPVHGRGRDTMRAVGLFVNTVVMRGQPRPGEPFSAWLRRNHGRTRDALGHADLPFAEVVALHQASRGPSRAPLVAVMFNFVRALGGKAATVNGFALGIAAPPLHLGPARLHPVPAPRPQAQTDLTLTMTQTRAGLHAEWAFDTGVLDAGTVASLAERFRTLLHAVVADPDRAVDRLALLTASELESAVVPGPRVARGPEHCVHRRVLARAAQDPDAVAVAGPDGELTYRQLAVAAGAVAALLASRRVGPESVVAVQMSRGPALAAAALGVLLAGGTFLPLDPDAPAERIAFLLADWRPALMLTDQTSAGQVPGSGVAVLPPLAELAARRPPRADWPDPVVSPEQLACVTYASGWAGEPAAMMVPHRALANLVDEAVSRWQLAPGKKLLSATRFGSGMATLELFAPLASGAALEFAAPDCAGAVEPATTGTPLPNTGAYVLDRYLTPVPAGVTGDLYLAGDGLPRCLRQPALTAERFVADPWGPAGTRMYRTGALVRRRRNGELDYLGRASEGTDGAARPTPAPASGRRSLAAPGGPVERVLHRLWSDVLGREDIGTSDEFFVFGGHSLAAMQLVAMIAEVLGVEVPLDNLMESATIAEQNRLVLALGRAQSVDVATAAELALAVADLSDAEVTALLASEVERPGGPGPELG